MRGLRNNWKLVATILGLFVVGIVAAVLSSLK